LPCFQEKPEIREYTAPMPNGSDEGPGSRTPELVRTARYSEIRTDTIPEEVWTFITFEQSDEETPHGAAPRARKPSAPGTRPPGQATVYAE